MEIDKKYMQLLIQSIKLRLRSRELNYKAHCSADNQRLIGFCDGYINCLDELEEAINDKKPEIFIAPKLL